MQRMMRREERDGASHRVPRCGAAPCLAAALRPPREIVRMRGAARSSVEMMLLKGQQASRRLKFGLNIHAITGSLLRFGSWRCRSVALAAGSVAHERR